MEGVREGGRGRGKLGSKKGTGHAPKAKAK